MNRLNRLSAAIIPACLATALAMLNPAAHAASFTLTPVTNTTSTFSGIISIIGTVTTNPGETFYAPSVFSSQTVPYLPGFTAGFTGVGNDWSPAFVAWATIGTGTYTGPIFDHVIVPGNFGYAGGMPVGLYGGSSSFPGSITLNYYTIGAPDRAITANYAVNVTAVPTPATLAAFGIGGLVASRRKR